MGLGVSCVFGKRLLAGLILLMTGHTAGMTGTGAEKVVVFMFLRIKGYTNRFEIISIRMIFTIRENVLKKRLMVAPEKRSSRMVHTGTIPLL